MYVIIPVEVFNFSYLCLPGNEFSSLYFTVSLVDGTPIMLWLLTTMKPLSLVIVLT